MNKHIYSYMKHYINLKISPEYALLISGKWGTGKTFFINNYLEKESHEEIKFIKISLFGIKSVNEIHKQIIFQLIGTKEGSLANSVIQIGSSILDAFGKKINLGINDIPIEQVLKTLTKKLDKEIIFIFDDLERITVNIPEILGYINILVERLQLKTILLANELELDKKNQYKEFKEKIIGKTFLLKQDFNTSFETFVELINLSKTVIMDNKTTIENIFIIAEYHNLRHVRQSLLDFEHFFENIEEKFQTHKELMQELIEIFFALSIEIKNGKFDIQDLNDFQYIKTFEYYDEQRTAEEEKKEFTRKPL
ncbi:MAG: AAA family ATPase, partial [Sulfurimonas sp.]|nr:AAA family ATPase [Sulfurimonas sp.]MBU4060219.1 KAP family NTPase [bacterium]